MKNIRCLLVIIFTLVMSVLLAQDGVSMFKKVEISFSEIYQNDSLISLELYQNGIFSSDESGIMGHHSSFNYDSLTMVYTLSYSFTGIGGGSDNRLVCPVLFVKLSFINKDSIRYFQLIPIVLSICGSSQIWEISILNIDLNELLDQNDRMILVSENNTYNIVAKEDIKLDKLVKIE